MKSLRRSGISTERAAISKFAGEPRKKFFSVRTDSAAAPLPARDSASARGSKSARITPADGDAFLSSAITAGVPSAARRSAAPNGARGGQSRAREKIDSKPSADFSASSSASLRARISSNMEPVFIRY